MPPTPPSAAHRPSEWLRPWVACVTLLSLLLAAYLPAWHGTPLWDDSAWLEDLLPLKQDLGGLWRMWTEPTAMQQYYPLAGTTFWLDQQLWGEWTLPYHLENILLHAVAALLLWRLLLEIEVPGAGLAGAVFLLHPVMVESVAWITERKNVLSMLFMLGGMLSYLRFQQVAAKKQPTAFRFETSHRRFFYGLSLLLCFLALSSKITAFVFAPALLLIFWWKKGSLSWGEDVRPTLPFVAITLALGLLITWLEVYHVGAEGKAFAAPLSERIITSGRAFWFYPGKLLWPVDLCFIYPDWRGSPVTAGQWAWPLSIPAVLVVLWCLRARIGRGPLAAVLFYLGAVFPVLGIMNVYGAVFAPVWDHWAYVPALGLLPLAAAVITRVLERAGRPWLLPAASTALLLLLTYQARQQTPQYASKEALWLETLRRNPAAWLAANNYGSELVTQHRYTEAVGHFRAAIAAHPTYAEAWNNLGGALVHLGQLEESLTTYRTAIDLDPELAPYTRHNMGNALLTLGRRDEAMEQYNASLALKPDYDEAHNSLAAALIQLDRLDEAIAHLREAIRLTPDYYQAHNNLGSALQKKGDLDAARAAYEESARLQPDFVEARYSLGEVLFIQGHLDAAIARYQEVLQLKPDHAKACYNLGIIHSDQQKLPEAEKDYLRAIAINPTYANAHNNLANHYLTTGRLPEAISHFQKAIAADPAQLAAMNNLAWVLATETDTDLRDGPKAVELARRAVELTHSEHPTILATLAAAYAEIGQYEVATMHARQGRDLAQKSGDSGLAASIEGNMRLFEARRPLRIQRHK